MDPADNCRKLKSEPKNLINCRNFLVFLVFFFWLKEIEMNDMERQFTTILFGFGFSYSCLM